jgi:predicted RNase H-like nuclease
MCSFCAAERTLKTIRTPVQPKKKIGRKRTVRTEEVVKKVRKHYRRKGKLDASRTLI